MDIKSILSKHEDTRRSADEARAKARIEAIAARKKTATENSEWARKTLLPILQRVSKELSEAGYPTQILERTAADDRYSDDKEIYLVGLEFRVAKQKNGSPSPNIKYSWGFESRTLGTELRHSTSNPPTGPMGSSMQQITAAEIEADIEKFLKLVYDGKA